MRRVTVEPDTELDRALRAAESSGESVELVHGARRYLLRPDQVGDPITEEERATRRAIMERALANRARQAPLGISTAELIREMRTERYGE
jgi:hypothetical protein